MVIAKWSPDTITIVTVCIVTIWGKIMRMDFGTNPMIQQKYVPSKQIKIDENNEDHRGDPLSCFLRGLDLFCHKQLNQIRYYKTNRL